MQQAWDVILSLYSFSPLEGVRLVGYARVPADSVMRTDGHLDAAAPVAAQWYDARPAFKPLHEALPTGSEGLDASAGAAASGWYSGSGVSPGLRCARVLAQVCITQKLPSPPAGAGALVPSFGGAGGAAAATAGELMASASSLVRRPKADPAAEGDGVDSEDQAAPAARSHVQKVDMRLAPLPLPPHGILAASPLYSAALKAARAQHGATTEAGAGVDATNRHRVVAADSTAAPLMSSERSLFVVIYQARSGCGEEGPRRAFCDPMPLCAPFAGSGPTRAAACPPLSSAR